MIKTEAEINNQIELLEPGLIHPEHIFRVAMLGETTFEWCISYYFLTDILIIAEKIS